MFLNINIYDENLNLSLILENRYISCFWSEGYNQSQPFTIEVANTELTRNRIHEGYYAVRPDRKTVMVITTVEITKNSIVATGEQATILLDDCGFVGTLKRGSIIDKAIPQAYLQSYQFPNLIFKETNLGIKYPQEISNKSFFELSNTVADATDTGIKVTKQNKTIVVEFYKPSDKPKKTFSEDFGNLMTQSITNSIKGFKNYAIVLGEGAGSERIRVDVDLSAGGVRRELIVDARDQQQKEETPEQYNQCLMSRGVEKLLERIGVFQISVTPLGIIGNDFDLGDIVTIRLRDYNLNFDARIVRFQQKAQNNNVETTIDIGQIKRR